MQLTLVTLLKTLVFTTSVHTAISAEDFNECSEGCHNCLSNITECVNAPGGLYNCMCTAGPGYLFDSTKSQCIDIDECKSIKDNICADYGPNAICINTDGSYECGCILGYRNNDTYCENINECAENTHNCPPNTKCTDMVGSYSYNCTEGFVGDGQVCEGIIFDGQAILAGLMAVLAVLSLFLITMIVIVCTFCAIKIAVFYIMDEAVQVSLPY